MDIFLYIFLGILLIAMILGITFYMFIKFIKELNKKACGIS